MIESSNVRGQERTGAKEPACDPSEFLDLVKLELLVEKKMKESPRDMKASTTGVNANVQASSATLDLPRTVCHSLQPARTYGTTCVVSLWSWMHMDRSLLKLHRL